MMLSSRFVFRNLATRPVRVPLQRAMAITPTKLTLLHLEFVEGMLEKRAPYREAHLKHVKMKADDGRLISGGAVGEAAGKGLLIFQNISNEEVEEHVKNDPYFQNGLVTKWYVEPYAVVEGLLKDKL